MFNGQGRRLRSHTAHGRRDDHRARFGNDGLHLIGKTNLTAFTLVSSRSRLFAVSGDDLV
jgi:hypothetical protein